MPGISFCHFQDFAGPWQPCLTQLFLPHIVTLNLYRNLIYILWYVQDKNLQNNKNANSFYLFQKVYYITLLLMLYN